MLLSFFVMKTIDNNRRLSWFTSACEHEEREVKGFVVVNGSNLYCINSRSLLFHSNGSSPDTKDHTQ